MAFKGPSAGPELLCSECQGTCGWAGLGMRHALRVSLTAECRAGSKLVGLWLGRKAKCYGQGSGRCWDVSVPPYLPLSTC